MDNTNSNANSITRLESLQASERFIKAEIRLLEDELSRIQSEISVLQNHKNIQ